MVQQQLSTAIQSIWLFHILRGAVTRVVLKIADKMHPNTAYSSNRISNICRELHLFAFNDVRVCVLCVHYHNLNTLKSREGIVFLGLIEKKESIIQYCN